MEICYLLLTIKVLFKNCSSKGTLRSQGTIAVYIFEKYCEGAFKERNVL